MSVCFLNDPATTEIYPLSLHDALPIFPRHALVARAMHVLRAVVQGRRVVWRDLHRRDALEAVDEILPRVAVERLRAEDRKSTRLNSSHANISYAAFRLKKNKTLPRLPQ